MSGVALTSASAGAMLVDLSEYARTRLPTSLTTSREFGSGEDLTLYAEVYENARKAAAHNVDVKVELSTADGRVVRTISQQRASTEVADGRNGFTLIVPLNGATAGDHVLRVEARSSVDDEILLIPGVGNRMLREFKEYRPYVALAQFHREIGKYVDATELARLEQYVFVPTK